MIAFTSTLRKMHAFFLRTHAVRLFSFIALGGVIGGGCSEIDSATVQTDAQIASYEAGRNLAAGLIFQMPGRVDYEALARGVQDAMEGRGPLLSQEETWAALNRLEAQIEEDRAARRAEEDSILRVRSRQPEVVALPSGLLMRTIEEGSGPTAGSGTLFTVAMRGTVADGTVFEDIGESNPLSQELENFPAGVREALLRMNVGQRAQLVVPSRLAFDARGKPPHVRPYQLVFYDITLIEATEP